MKAYRSDITVKIVADPKQAVLHGDENKEIGSVTYSSIALQFKLGDKSSVVPYSSIKRRTRILDEIVLEKDKLLGIFKLNQKAFYVFTDHEGRILTSTNPNHFMRMKRKFIALAGLGNLYFIGHLTNNTRAKEYNYVYVGEDSFGKVLRPFGSLWKLKNIAFIKIPLNKISTSNQMHNALAVGGSSSNPILPLKHIAPKRKSGMKYLLRKRFDDKLILVRTTSRSRSIMVTQIPFTYDHTAFFTLKVNIARILAAITPSKKINLFFEKESRRAQESGYYIFRKAIEYTRKKGLESKNYFVLDPLAEEYSEVKSSYGNLVVDKYSLRHCYLIFKSNYFISSEMSNHAVSTRVYNKYLNKVINAKPLIFLQHGIMFAKPVDNPAAMGFWKIKTPINVYKSVISSDLEAEQFYKMGYDPKDLIKCGLPKFDISYQDSGADKIMFMPTYRYWEEAMVMDEKKIVDTTYYKSLLNIIRHFESNGLLDKLLVAPHPKFADKVSENSPQYKDILVQNIDEALKKTKIFITDYSSASYDAHYRGASIIYYWKERDYLVDNYKAIPPINESNCDGKPVYSEKELITEVKNIIKNNYKKDPKYERRYRKINEFSDNKNWLRLTKELEKLGIL